MIGNWILIGLFSLIVLLSLYFFIAGVVPRFFEHRHKWQARGRNRYGVRTYRMCLKCRERQKRVNKINEEERWETCEPIPELDAQFDENDNYIWNH